MKRNNLDERLYSRQSINWRVQIFLLLVPWRFMKIQVLLLLLMTNRLVYSFEEHCWSWLKWQTLGLQGLKSSRIKSTRDVEYEGHAMHEPFYSNCALGKNDSFFTSGWLSRMSHQISIKCNEMACKWDLPETQRDSLLALLQKPFVWVNCVLIRVISSGRSAIQVRPPPGV